MAPLILADKRAAMAYRHIKELYNDHYKEYTWREFIELLYLEGDINHKQYEELQP